MMNSVGQGSEGADPLKLEADFKNAGLTKIDMSAEMLQAVNEKDLRILVSRALLDRLHTDLTGLSVTDQVSLIKSRSTAIVLEEDLSDRFTKFKAGGDPLIVKFGVDATGNELHLGHIVPIKLAARLQRMGHQVQLVVGDFTARIGDPSGRNESRPPLSVDQIKENVRTYLQQMSPFLQVEQTKVLFNSDWLSKMTLSDGLRLFGKMSVTEGLNRTDFRERMAAGGGVTQAELLYANLMGIDSQVMNADIEVGGHDQTINFHTCRRIMELNGSKPEIFITSPIIPGISGEGQKMSKSLGNYIGLLASAEDMYGKIMSIPDSLLEIYFKSLTELTDIEWTVLNSRMSTGELNPKIVKETLATTIVGQARSLTEANMAYEQFISKFGAKSYHQLENLPSVHIKSAQTIIDVLFDNKFVTSRGEARRLISGGAVSLIDFSGNAEKVSFLDQIPLDLRANSEFLKVGKRGIVRVVFFERE